MLKLWILYIFAIPCLGLRIARQLEEVPNLDLAKEGSAPDMFDKAGRDSYCFATSSPRYDKLVHSQHQKEEINFRLDSSPLKHLTRVIGNLKFGQNCPNAATPKVAVCIVGLSRRFASPSQTAYIKSKLLQPIKDAGGRGLGKGEPDVFVHTKLGDPNKVAPARQASGHDLGNTREFVMASIQEVGAIDFVIEDGFGPVVGRQNLTNKKCFHPHRGAQGLRAIMSYYRSINGCLDLIKKAEESSGDKYDVVIHSRPDNWEVEEETKWTQNAVQCRTPLFLRDTMSFQPRASFERFGNYWNDQFQNENPDMCGFHDVPEALIDDICKKVKGRSIR